MISQKIPCDVKLLLKTLQDNGHNAHIVGGCVRDVLMHKTPCDWDICTDALPHMICEMFKDYKLIKNGMKHGTVAVIVNSIPYEITTYRTDGEYRDNRHPDNVSFVSDIKYDLERRDFTVNSIAYNEKDGIVDLFGGQNDIEDKIIRAIGNPDERFMEDSLRILRALRFSQTLGFSIEDNTKASILKNKELLGNISAERINTEFVKILLADNKDVLYEFYEVFSVIFGFSDIKKELLQNLKKLPKILYLRLSAYLLLCSFNEYTIKDLLYRLRFDKNTIKKTLEILKNYEIELIPETLNVRMAIKKLGEQLFLDILTIKTVFSKNSEECEKIKKLYSEIMSSDMVQTVDKLDLDGNDLISSGITGGKNIGYILDKLVELIIIEDIPNKKDILIKKAIEINSSAEVKE